MTSPGWASHYPYVIIAKIENEILYMLSITIARDDESQCNIFTHCEKIRRCLEMEISCSDKSLRLAKQMGVKVGHAHRCLSGPL